MTVPSTYNPVFEAYQKARVIYDKAWGQQWPRRFGTISKADISLASPPTSHTDAIDVDDDSDEEFLPDNYDDAKDDNNNDETPVPDSLTYECLYNITELWDAFDITTTVGDNLIVREEYITLREILETGYLSREAAIVLTGQPGIGKTAFLFYLFLYRLEHQKPTAIQTNKNIYYIFDHKGALVVPASNMHQRLRGCWALADSNANLEQPCPPFQSIAGRKSDPKSPSDEPNIARTIQVSPPEPTRWKKWITQKQGSCLITELPNALEIGAIVRERGLDASFTLRLVRKWGPSTRTILNIVDKGKLGEKSATLRVNRAAMTVCADPASAVDATGDGIIPSSQCSDLVFCRPRRRTSKGLIVNSANGAPVIPTAYLRNIVDNYSDRMTTTQSLALADTFASHTLTRQSGRWAHESTLHKLASLRNDPILISRDGEDDQYMQPASRLLPGTLGGLKLADASDAFYWRPSVTNFPGIDGVLGGTDGNIYVLQATIPSKHRSPSIGLEKLYAHLRPHVAQSRKWKFVIVGRKQERLSVDALVVACKALESVNIGAKPKTRRGSAVEPGVPVTVWRCVI